MESGKKAVIYHDTTPDAAAEKIGSLLGAYGLELVITSPDDAEYIEYEIKPLK